MPVQRIETASALRPQTAAADADAVPEYPVREYIGAMALELAQMARWASDEPLAVVLDQAAALAAARLAGEPVETAPAARRRPA